MKTIVYLAGGMKSAWRDLVINGCEDNIEFISPCNHLLDNPKQYTLWDLHAIKKSDIIFGLMEPDNPSGIGLSLEIGYAKALGKTIILCDQKSEIYLDFKRKFEIVRNSCDILFDDLSDAIDYLNSFSRLANVVLQKLD